MKTLEVVSWARPKKETQMQCVAGRSTEMLKKAAVLISCRVLIVKAGLSLELLIADG